MTRLEAPDHRAMALRAAALQWSLGEAISFCRVWPWGVLFGFYLGLTLLLLTDTDIVRRSRVIHNKEDKKSGVSQGAER